MTVYFARAGQDGPVKIGRAADPEKRIRDLNVGAPVPLRLVRVIAGNSHEEAQLHRRYRAQRLHGEWFTWSDDMMATEVEPPKASAVDELLSLFGGLTGSRKALGERDDRTLNGWRKAGRIPHFRRFQVRGAAVECGIAIPDELWCRLFPKAEAA